MKYYSQAQVIWMYIFLSCLLLLAGVIHLNSVQVHKMYTAVATRLTMRNNSAVDIQPTELKVKPLTKLGYTPSEGEAVNRSLPIAVLVTMVPNGKNDFNMVNNSLSNWAKLKPNIEPVLITDKGRDSNRLTHTAEQAGWQVLELPVDEFKSLKLGDVHSKVADIYPNVQFQCISKYDLLFTYHLNFTMVLLKNHFVNRKQNVLVSGAHRLFTLHDNQELFTSENISSVKEKTGEHRYYCTDNWGSIPDSPANVENYNRIFGTMNGLLGTKLHAIDVTDSNSVVRQIMQNTVLAKKPQRKIGAISRLYTRNYRKYFELWRKDYEVFEFDLNSGQGRLLTDEI